MGRPRELALHPFLAHIQEKLQCEDLTALSRKTEISYQVLRDWGFYNGFEKSLFANVDLLSRKTGYTHAQIRDGFAGTFKPWLEPVPV